MTTSQGIHRIVDEHPWRSLGFAAIAGAVIALLPRRFVRTVAVAMARDAVMTFLAGGDEPAVEHHAAFS